MNAQETDKIIDLLLLEANRPVSRSELAHLLEEAQPIRLSTYDPLIDSGQYDPNIYVIKSGLLRGTYLDKNMERTVAFGLPGTILINFHSFYAHEPSFFRFEACCASEVLRIPRVHFDNMLAASHEFALWMLSAHQNQLFYHEVRKRLLCGDAKTRLRQLADRLADSFPTSAVEAAQTKDSKNAVYTRWKEIFKLVPSKIIASYIGITEQHLSKIKRELLFETFGK